jgi:predicted DNA-binding antitoxin AbrB/MazE fold protein
MSQSLTLRMYKKDGKLIIPEGLSMEKFKFFLNTLQEGETVDVLFEIRSATGTKAQLAKIHACINEMAKEQGQSAEETKKDIKHKCGLYTEDKNNRVYRSFSDCSKDELSNVIEVIHELGVFLNINFGDLLKS